LQNIKEGIQGKPVDWYSDVFDLVFPNLDKDAANSLWKKELKRPSKAQRDREEKAREEEEEEEDSD